MQRKPLSSRSMAPRVSRFARRGRTAPGDRGGIYRTVSGNRLGIKRSRTEIETKLFCAVFSGVAEKVSGNVRFSAARHRDRAGGAARFGLNANGRIPIVKTDRISIAMSDIPRLQCVSLTLEGEGKLRGLLCNRRRGGKDERGPPRNGDQDRAMHVKILSPRTSNNQQKRTGTPISSPASGTRATDESNEFPVPRPRGLKCPTWRSDSC